MIEYLVTQNPDNRILGRVAKSLADGQLICFPSDTSWLMACDPFNAKAVERMYRIKNEGQDHPFSLLCSGIKQSTQVAMVDDYAFNYMRTRVPGHFTFILPALKRTAKALKASRREHQVGIRIPPCPIFIHLSKVFEGPLLSTNITTDLLGLEEEAFIYPILIEEELGREFATILDPGEYEFCGPSTIVDLSAPGESMVLRQGAGKVN